MVGINGRPTQYGRLTAITILYPRDNRPYELFMETLCEIDALPFSIESGCLPKDRCSMSEFDRMILDYIRKKLREGIRDAAIIEELTDSTDPLFVSICGDVGITADYLAHAKTSITPRDTRWE